MDGIPFILTYVQRQCREASSDDTFCERSQMKVGNLFGFPVNLALCLIHGWHRLNVDNIYINS